LTVTDRAKNQSAAKFAGRLAKTLTPGCAKPAAFFELATSINGGIRVEFETRNGRNRQEGDENCFLVGVDVTMIAAKRSIYGWIGVQPKT
jgi:hypothetical protein